MIAGSPWRKWKHKAILAPAAAAGLVAALMSACGGLPKTHYYTVAMPAPAPVNDSKTPFVLDVQRFRAPEVLRDDRILYYESPTELNYYEYHRWSADPAEMTAELVARRLRGMDVFAQVRLFPHTTPGDYVLNGQLLNFEEVDYETGGRVRVGLELTLVRTHDQTVVWSDRRLTERDVQGKGVAAVVNALNASTAQLLNEVFPGLLAEVERESKQNPKQSP